jgi:hypothetical protein
VHVFKQVISIFYVSERKWTKRYTIHTEDTPRQLCIFTQVQFKMNLSLSQQPLSNENLLSYQINDQVQITERIDSTNFPNDHFSYYYDAAFLFPDAQFQFPEALTLVVCCPCCLTSTRTHIHVNRDYLSVRRHTAFSTPCTRDQTDTSRHLWLSRIVPFNRKICPPRIDNTPTPPGDR